MAGAQQFLFEPAPQLPGADRVSKYVFGAIRKSAPRLWDLEIEGRENIPTDGPAIIAPNHLSFCDSIFVPAALPRRVWAIGKGEYMDSWKTKHLFPAMGMIPIDRSGGDAAQAALDTAASVLDSGLLFMIYPEGTRSRSGHLHKGRTGAARLASRCDAPIVPVGHIGTVEVQPPDTFVMKPNKTVTVRFGAPMRIEDYGDPDDPRTARRYTDAVMFEIAQLSEQRYVDRYADKDDKPGELAGGDATVSIEPIITPRAPSVIGSSPTSVTRPPSRPRASVNGANANGASADGRGTNGSVDTATPPSMPDVKLPPGRVSRPSR